MAITDRTRKLLWGRSGNRCAICKKELIIEATPNDDASIVGEECHIKSGQANGPRHDSSIPADKVDIYDNLLLLCRVHHKMIDDQYETYTVNILKQIKSNHEKWVSEKLSQSQNNNEPVKVKRLKNNIPEYLVRISTGEELFSTLGSCGLYYAHDELLTNDEVDIISNFLQSVQDWIDLYFDLDVGDKIKATYSMNEEIQNVEKAGFFIFCAKETQILEGGIGEPVDWPVCHLRILRNSNDTIISFKNKY